MFEASRKTVEIIKCNLFLKVLLLIFTTLPPAPFLGVQISWVNIQAFVTGELGVSAVLIVALRKK